MYTRYRTIEYNEATMPAFEWITYVPDADAANPLLWKITRGVIENGQHVAPGKKAARKHYTMDSHTVRKAGKTAFIERVVNLFRQTGHKEYVENHIVRARTESEGREELKPSRQKKRASSILYPVSAVLEAGDPSKGTPTLVLLDFILDDRVPVWYQVVVPRDKFDDPQSWRINLYRRLNPRSDTPRYGMRPMAAGSVKATSLFGAEELETLAECIETMSRIIIPDTPMANSLEIFKRQLAKADSRYTSTFEPHSSTITHRLRELVKPMLDTLARMMREQTPENIAAWQSILVTAKQNNAALKPKFLEHQRSLEARAAARRPENSSNGLGMARNSGIPPMPTHLLNGTQNATTGLGTPTNAIDAIANLLGGNL